jgi:hypothetical protein
MEVSYSVIDKHLFKDNNDNILNLMKRNSKSSETGVTRWMTPVLTNRNGLNTLHPSK